ncbi:MAG: endolytic transglycosylase MltG [Propionibacteriaceae bacterium]|nr:endolytic transglycosylase MltG [Propionibacteriaceae bacterium]
MSPAFVENDGKYNWQKIGYHARSAFAVLLSIAILVGGGWFVYDKAQDAWTAFRTEDDYIGEGVDKITVTIPSGATVTQIGDVLVQYNVIKSTKTFRKVASKEPKSATLQSGRYKLRTELPAATALQMMLDPANLKVIRVVLPEGFTVGRQWTYIEQQLAKQGITITREELAAGLIPEELNLPLWSRGKVEGFLFPETYAVAEPVSAVRIFEKQVAQFTKVTDEMGFVNASEVMAMDPFDVLTIASIIEREVNKQEYRPMVSAVIQNRLKAGMPLQMDSTVHYALQDFGKVTTTAEDRLVDSPYNTYRNTGLPPGAISNPGEAALDAAAHPAASDALYFVTVDLDSGETRFAATLPEHDANVALFQAWCSANSGRC